MSRDLRRSRLRSQAEEGAGPFKPVAIPAVKAAVSIGERQTASEATNELNGQIEDSPVARKQPSKCATPRV
jgi:hypothetical protein